MIVRLHHCSGHLWGRGDGEGQLGLAAIVDGQALQQKGAKARACASAGGVEDHEALETSAVVGQLADAVQHQVDDFLADRVVTTSVVVSSILLAGDQLLRVVKLAVSTRTHFVNHSGLQIKVYAAGNVLASTSLREKGVERVITTAHSLVRRHLTIRLDSVLKAQQFPASVSSLHASLANVNI